MGCERTNSCQFFIDIMAGMPKTADYIKKKYCLACFEVCARYRIYKEFNGEAIPVRLFPFDSERGARILKRLRREQRVHPDKSPYS